MVAWITFRRRGSRICLEHGCRARVPRLWHHVQRDIRSYIVGKYIAESRKRERKREGERERERDSEGGRKKKWFGTGGRRLQRLFPASKHRLFYYTFSPSRENGSLLGDLRTTRAQTRQPTDSFVSLSQFSTRYARVDSLGEIAFFLARNPFRYISFSFIHTSLSAFSPTNTVDYRTR